MTARTRVGPVRDDDPQWLRFWHPFPWKIAKLDARKAFAQLAPDIDLMDRIVTALGWQVPLWTSQGFGCCYPATYLRGERWMDQPPPGIGPRERTCRYGHLPPCNTTAECTLKVCTDARRARAGTDES